MRFIVVYKIEINPVLIFCIPTHNTQRKNNGTNCDIYLHTAAKLHVIVHGKHKWA